MAFNIYLMMLSVASPEFVPNQKFGKILGGSIPISLMDPLIDDIQPAFKFFKDVYEFDKKKLKNNSE